MQTWRSVAMTEKTFRDMLPLTYEQRKELEKTIPFCGFCVCSFYCKAIKNNNPNGCLSNRKETLRLDDEFRMENMKKDILHTIVDPDEQRETGADDD
jgi:hypothetical protein